MSTKNLLIGGGILLAAGAIVALKPWRNIPKGAKAVKPFDKEKYLGKWYEIARLDFLFEKNIDYATAEYSLNEDDSIKVVNSGYNYKKQRKEISVGKAKFAGSPSEAKLKVSFWGPFYSGYNVVAIDPEYKYALVIGKNHNYMWILSREKEMPEDVKQDYLRRAEDLGYKTSKLVWTKYS